MNEKRALWVSENLKVSPQKILDCLLINKHKYLSNGFTVKKPGIKCANQVMKFNITSNETN